MVQKTNKQTKEEAHKAERKAEKQAKKDANVAKVEKTKAEKVEKQKPENKPAKVSQPTIKQVKDVWETLALEKRGITVNDDGSYVDPGRGVNLNSITKQKTKRLRKRVNKKGHHYPRPTVCVAKKNGEKVRVLRAEATELVAAGGSYIAKHEFKEEWEHKK